MGSVVHHCTASIIMDIDRDIKMSSLSFSVSVPTVSSSDASQTSHPQVDDLSSNLSHMCQVEDSMMEDSLSQEEVELEDKFSQARARSDPVYIHQQLQLQQQQLQLQQQQQLQQQLQLQHQQQQLQLQPQYHP